MRIERRRRDVLAEGRQHHGPLLLRLHIHAHEAMQPRLLHIHHRFIVMKIERTHRRAKPDHVDHLQRLRVDYRHRIVHHRSDVQPRPVRIQLCAVAAVPDPDLLDDFLRLRIHHHDPPGVVIGHKHAPSVRRHGHVMRHPVQRHAPQDLVRSRAHGNQLPRHADVPGARPREVAVDPIHIEDLTVRRCREIIHVVSDLDLAKHLVLGD